MISQPSSWSDQHLLFERYVEPTGFTHSRQQMKLLQRDPQPLVESEEGTDTEPQNLSLKAGTDYQTCSVA